MKAYKATNKDMTCNNFQYELNKEFVHKGKLLMCRSGFHFCKNLKDIDFYYSFKEPDNRFFEIDIPDDACIRDYYNSESFSVKSLTIPNKSVTNKIKFIRELTEKDFADHGIYRKYDIKNRLIEYRESLNYIFRDIVCIYVYKYYTFKPYQIKTIKSYILYDGSIKHFHDYKKFNKEGLYIKSCFIKKGYCLLNNIQSLYYKLLRKK